jgi:hypothetical protein
LIPAFGLTAAIVLAPSPAFTQAWTPPAGSGSVNVAVQAIDNTGHLLNDGSLLKDGKSRNASIYLEAEYALTDRWSVSAGLPFVFARYIGPRDAPGPPQPVDVCRCWHGAWQDFAISAQYNAVKGSVSVTPFIAFAVPSHGYRFRGEAVAGRRLREARLGVAVGRRLDAVSSRLSVQGSYSYAVVQRVLDVPNNRSNGTFEGAFHATRKVSMRGFLTWQRTHGGLRAIGQPPANGYPWGEIVSEPLFANHDRLLRDNNLHVGSGAAFSLPRFDVFGSYIRYLRGTNSHAGNVFTAGVSYPFEWQPRRAKD